jgi:hypothetical protein
LSEYLRAKGGAWFGNEEMLLWYSESRILPIEFPEQPTGQLAGTDRTKQVGHAQLPPDQFK